MGALIGLGILLAVIWVVALLLFKVAGFAIHLLLILAVIMIVIGFIKRVR
jgi:hypothetical protein